MDATGLRKQAGGKKAMFDSATEIERQEGHWPQRTCVDAAMNGGHLQHKKQARAVLSDTSC